MPKKCTHLNKYLPADFQPGPYSVICGKGRENFDSCGNRRFRLLVQMRRQRYAECKVRVEKSAIVSEIIDTTRSCGGDFVKWDDKRCQWFIISEPLIREKVGSAFRDCLISKYSSATKNKNARRLAGEKLERQRRKRPSSVPASMCDLSSNQPPAPPQPLSTRSNDDASSKTSREASAGMAVVSAMRDSLSKKKDGIGFACCTPPPPPLVSIGSMIFEKAQVEGLEDLLMDDVHDFDVDEVLGAF